MAHSSLLFFPIGHDAHTINQITYTLLPSQTRGVCAALDFHCRLYEHTSDCLESTHMHGVVVAQAIREVNSR